MAHSCRPTLKRNWELNARFALAMHVHTPGINMGLRERMYHEMVLCPTEYCHPTPSDLACTHHNTSVSDYVEPNSKPQPSRPRTIFSGPLHPCPQNVCPVCPELCNPMPLAYRHCPLPRLSTHDHSRGTMSAHPSNWALAVPSPHWEMPFINSSGPVELSRSRVTS